MMIKTTLPVLFILLLKEKYINSLNFIFQEKKNSLPPLGTQILRYRQSSDSWISFGCIFRRYCRRLNGILVMAIEALEISGKAWGQTGP